MGTGLRRSIGTALVIILLVPAISASGDEFIACWTVEEVDSFGIRQTITRCRIAGGEIVDYASDAAVPAVLYPMLGTDLTGECWYYISQTTQYVILTLYANGDADIAWDPDPGDPGGLMVIGPNLARCTSEPTPAADSSELLVWEYVTEYIHPPPVPDLNPSPLGVTGMVTYAGVEIPPQHTATLSSGATTLDVFIEVAAVVIDWGDGTVRSYAASDTVLAGYPDGRATHVYEVKDPAYSVSISYEWTARWRVAGGAWQTLPVPATTTSVEYPVAEIVSVLTP